MITCEQSEKDDRHSDPNLEEKLQQTAKALNEEKRKSARRKEYDQFCDAVLLCYCGHACVAFVCFDHAALLLVLHKKDRME